jgi:hypothetical protein
MKRQKEKGKGQKQIAAAPLPYFLPFALCLLPS